jgi:hypothetical protein
VALALLGGAPGAFAQEIGFGMNDEEDVVYTEITQVGDRRAHVVRNGDTLWTIAALYLGSTEEWPKLWAMNPQITNPHWIFPGDLVFLDAGKGGAEPQPAAAPDTLHSNLPIARPPQLVRTVGFLASREYSAVGTLARARGEKSMLSTYDEVYLEIEDRDAVSVGQRFTVYREEEEIEHPRSNDAAGWLVKYLGRVRITDKSSPKYVKAVVEDVIEELERGDKLTAHFEPLHRVSAREAAVDLEAVVVTIFGETVLFGQNQYVFIDKGSDHNVEMGNRFRVVERGDMLAIIDGDLEPDDEDFPEELSGELLVIEVFEDHCLAIATHALHELEAGARLRLVRGY